MRRILYVQYTNPAAYPPLEHSSRILANAGWQVLFLGTGAHGADALRFPPHPNIVVKKLPYCPPGWRQKVHYLLFCLWVVGWTIRWRPAWIYVSGHPSTPVVWLLSFGTRAIYHEHDSPRLEDVTTHFGRLCLRTRTWLARRAGLCVLPNEERARDFQRQTAAVPERVVCVWNCPRRQEAAQPGDAELAASRPRQADALVLFYHGSIVPSQLPDTVLHALVDLPGHVRLEIAGYETIGHQGYKLSLKDLAERLGIGSRVVFHGSLPTRRELLSLCRQCDVGLALFSPQTLQPMTGASNKPFDYMGCGLALLVSDMADWQQMFVRPGHGLACDPQQPESIARAVRRFLDHPEERRAMGEANRQRILTDWNYELQFAPVKNRLEYGGKLADNRVCGVEEP